MLKDVQIVLDSTQYPSPRGSEYVRLALDLKVQDPVKVQSLLQYVQSALADRKVSLQEVLGFFLLASL